MLYLHSVLLLDPIRNSRERKNTKQNTKTKQKTNSQQSKEQGLLSGMKEWARVNGLALKYIRGTSTISAKRKKEGKNVNEHSDTYFPP